MHPRQVLRASNGCAPAASGELSGTSRGGPCASALVSQAWVDDTQPGVNTQCCSLQVVLLGAVEKYRSDGQGPPGYSPGVGQFESDIFNGLDNLYPGAPHASAMQPQAVLMHCQQLAAPET